MYSILIIEDDPASRNIMEVMLQMEGFNVRSAADGPTGLALLRLNRPDLILCDILMPDMDGHMVLDTLKGVRELADIPFIFVTCMRNRVDVRRGMSEGADDYLPKPFSEEELLAAVTGRIRRHKVILRGTSAFKEEQSTISQKITKREREILLLVGQGATSRDIASRLEVSLKTIEAHRANLMNKLNVGNAASLARWAFIAEQMERDPDNAS